MLIQRAVKDIRSLGLLLLRNPAKPYEQGKGCERYSQKDREQLELARCQKNGTLYAPKRLKKVTNEAGERVVVETTKRVKEWFWTTPNNKINLSVRYGSKTLELAKGKNAIELGTQDELIETLALLQQVVIGGELDEAINNASEKLKAGFVK